MRANLVVVTTPLLDHDLGFLAIAKPLLREAFVLEATVEAFVGLEGTT